MSKNVSDQIVEMLVEAESSQYGIVCRTDTTIN